MKYEWEEEIDAKDLAETASGALLFDDFEVIGVVVANLATGEAACLDAYPEQSGIEPADFWKDALGDVINVYDGKVSRIFETIEKRGEDAT